MKVYAVLSDTHGDIQRVIEALKKENVDYLFHLGDFASDGEKIAKALKIPYTVVEGNCDYSNQKMKIVTFENRRILLTHGHRFNIHWGLGNLFYTALEEKADLVLFGHSHVSTVIKEKGIVIANPGSPTYPRGADKPGYFLMTLTPEITIRRKVLE